MLLGNEKGWTTDTGYVMGKFQNHYAKWKKPDVKRPHSVWFYLYNVLKKQNYRYREPMSGCHGLG